MKNRNYKEIKERKIESEIEIGMGVIEDKDIIERQRNREGRGWGGKEGGDRAWKEDESLCAVDMLMMLL